MIAEVPSVSRKKARIPAIMRPGELRLPEVSESQKVQRPHVRRLKTKKGVELVGINLGTQPIPIRPQVVVPRPRISLPAPPVSLPPRMPEPLWKQVLKPDKSSLSLRARIEKEMLSKDVQLEEGENIAVKILSLEIPLGYHVDVKYLDIDGKEQVFIGKISGSPVTDRFMKFLQDAKDKGKKIIFKVTSNDELQPMPGPGGIVMGWMAGTTELGYVRPFNGGPKLKSAARFRNYVRQNLPDGRMLILETNEKGKMTGHSRLFNNEKEFHQAWQGSSISRTDMFGVRWDENVDLAKVVPIERMSAEEMFKQWRSTVYIPQTPPRPLDTGKLSPTVAYELLEGEDWSRPGEKFWTVAVISADADGLMKAGGDGFKSRAAAEAYIRKLKSGEAKP